MSRSAPSFTVGRSSTVVWLVSSIVGVGFGIWISWAVQRWWLMIPASAVVVGMLRWWLCRQVMTPSHHSSLAVHILSWVSLAIPIVSFGIYYSSRQHSTEQLIPVQLVAVAMALVSLGTLRGWRSFDVLISGVIAIPLALTVAYHLVFANMRIWR
jgi:hypothetical protein